MTKRKSKRKDDVAEFLILAPYRHHLEVAHYRESRIIRANCGHLAWLSPQGEPYVEKRYTCCEDCGQEAISGPDAENYVLPGVLDYLQRLHGDEAVQEAREKMRRLGVKEEE